MHRIEKMNNYRELSVKDHLHALGHEEPWMTELAEMIREFTGCDTAIAAGRAFDLSENPRYGQAVGAMTKGFLVICREMEDGRTLSENQRETMRQLLRGMTERLAPLFAK